MRKLLFILFSIMVLPTAWADTHRCGTFNIRTIVETDTGEKAWTERRKAVVDMIKDTLQYDIVGLNEVSATQLTYLKQQLDTVYSFVQRSGATSNQVLYRTSRYACLDQGSFFLAPDPSKATKGWDAQYIRWTVWAKLQDKTTGEIIFFGSTHLDLNPISIREGARVNAEQMNKIAGDYACIVAGDMNSEPNQHDPHANFNAYLGNARQMSKTTPKGRYGTFIPSMKPSTIDAKLLDYLYVRNVEIESYYVCSSIPEGRTLTISDHLPVMCQVTVLPPKRTFIHNVTTVQELREQARQINPNDIIYLKDGVFDLGDSSLYVANTCVIEGSKRAVLTGQTQLFSLPDYISLEVNNLTIRGARCASGVQGSIVRAHGKYLRLHNCVIDGCSTSGEGLLYAEDCEADIENCRFSANRNEDQDVGIHLMSNVGVDRYPLTMRSCVFENNYSYYAPAVYFNSEATAYLFGNSFVGNESEEKGTVVLYSPTNEKDLRLVNNTFANNRIDVSSGFMDEAIGGSAIWQELSEKGRMTLVNNTIVGNYTACWESEGVGVSNFPSGAIRSYSGQLALYNNIIAGNYSPLAKRGDISIVDPYMVKGIAYNVFSCTEAMEVMPGKTDFVAANYMEACQELTQLYQGWVEDKVAFHPYMQYYGDSQMPILSPFVTTYAGQNIAVINMDAVSASLLGSDIMNRGSNTGFLTMDQLELVRNMPSVPGAMEAGRTQPSDINEVQNAECTMQNAAKLLIDGQLLIWKDGKIYSLTGSRL